MYNNNNNNNNNVCFSKWTYTGVAMSVVEGIGLEGGDKPAATSIASSSGICKGEKNVEANGSGISWSLRLLQNKNQKWIKKALNK
jgi:hypothetical protein